MKIEPESTVFSRNYALNIGGRLMDLTTTKIMGILNVTDDSFYDGGKYTTEQAILDHARGMLEEGASIIDVGAHSTRPGAPEVPLEDEKRKITKVIKLLKKEFPSTALSVDTFRNEVARAGVGEGAAMINDVSGGSLDPQMFATVAELKIPYVLMHMRGTPATMASLNQYDNLLLDIIKWLQTRVKQLEDLGVKDIVLDPGFGFSKSIQQNFYMLQNLERFSMLDRPLLVGLSRKSMVWRTLGVTPEQALNGTTALHAIAVTKGAALLRVHDVREAKQTITLMTEINRGLS